MCWVCNFPNTYLYIYSCINSYPIHTCIQNTCMCWVCNFLWVVGLVVSGGSLYIYIYMYVLGMRIYMYTCMYRVCKCTFVHICNGSTLSCGLLDLCHQVPYIPSKEPCILSKEPHILELDVYWVCNFLSVVGLV